MTGTALTVFIVVVIVALAVVVALTILGATRARTYRKEVTIPSNTAPIPSRGESNPQTRRDSDTPAGVQSNQNMSGVPNRMNEEQ